MKTQKNQNDIHFIMTLERYEAYIRAGRAIVHTCRNDTALGPDHLNNLWHVFDLMGRDVAAMKNYTSARANPHPLPA